MPILVHLTSDKNTAKILRSGIRGKKIPGLEASGIRGVFCMPVLPNFYISHQWLRELKRAGQRRMVGVYIRIHSNEPVWVGRYNQQHKQTSLGKAIQQIMSIADPQGHQVIVPRSISPREIQRVRSLPQGIGWRYFPGSHGDKPSCQCPACVPKGSIKSQRLRRRCAQLVLTNGK